MKKLFGFLTLLAFGLGAFAQTTWSVSVTNTGNPCRFKIERTGDKSQAVTVRYRTVSLSAFEGQHFTAVSGNVTFLANEDKKYIDVMESTPSIGAYMYQNGTERSYRFEVTDMGGFYLAHCDRTKTTGTYVQPYNVFATNNVTIKSGEITVTDAGYAQAYHSMNVSNYFNNTAPSAYFQLIGAELRMKLSFQCKEVYDGWQYVQIYANQNINNIDSNNGADGGNPGACSYSKYAAGFEHKHGSKDPEYKSYTFPVTSVGNNAGATNPWGYGDKYNLHLQKFNGSRASDGRLIIPTDLTSLYIRYDASGSDQDDWVAKNTVAHIQAVDGTAPTMLAISVAPGYHAKGNTIYVSVAFSEIVRVPGSPTLSTTDDNNWGTLSYVEGNGSNVLTFSTTIPDDAEGNLNIIGLNGTVKDLAGNSLTGGVTASNLCSLDTSYAYPITYNLDGGSVATANPATYTYYTPTFTLNNPTRLGYEYNGWTGSNGNTPQTTVTINYHSNGNKSYTANWTANTYSVRFNANAETGTAATGTMSDQNFIYDQAQNLTANAFEREGYTFTGWTTQPDGMGDFYSNQQSVNNLTNVQNGVVTLYAKWSLIDWTGDGSSGDPYLIIYASQLMKLSKDVNDGETYYFGSYFKLGDNIDMDGVDFD